MSSTLELRTAPAAAWAASPGSSPPPGQSSRLAPLDGLRGLALVAVMLYHVAPSSAAGGFLGVESFFVLSGYLLTSVLLREHDRRGAIDRRAYAARRLRRIAPALLALLGTLVFLGPLVAPDDAHRLLGDALSSLAGLTNWHLIADAASYFDQAGRPSFVRHLWSIAVEIQFYVVCPFLVAWLARRRRGVALAVLAAGMMLSALAMALAFEGGDPSRAYYGTDVRVGGLLAGGFLAFVLAGDRQSWSRRWVEGSRSWRPPVGLGLGALTILVGLFLLADDRARLSYPAAFLATQMATAVVIAASLHAGVLARLLGFWPFAWLGQRSYGIYLWHWPAVVLLRPDIDVSWSPLLAGAATIAFAVVAGSLSYTLVELPFLREPSRWSTSGRVRLLALPAVAGVALLALAGGLVRLPSTDPLAQTLRAGERVLADQEPADPGPDATRPFPTTTATDAGASAVRLPEPADGTAAPPGAQITAVGDSVMVSAAGALRDRLGQDGFVDALNSRQFDDGIGVVRGLEDSASSDVAVVHLGNNGPIDHDAVDALLSALADVPEVLLVNVRVSARWQDSVNQTLAEAAEHHPSVTLVDWFARSAGHREWFQSDGTHFRTISGPGANAYAELIVASVPTEPRSSTLLPRS